MFISSASVFGNMSIREKLEKIPLEDRMKLEKFFKILVVRDGFGYTLWGSKPATLTHWHQDYSFQQTLGCGVIECAHLKTGLMVWKQYCHLFTIKNYLFYDHTYLCDNDRLVEMVLVNKSEFESLKEQYPSLFKDLSAIDLFANYVDQNYFIQLGLAFGYGERNAILFDKRMRVNDSIASLPTVPNAAFAQMNRLEILRLKYRGSSIKSDHEQKPLILDYIVQQNIHWKPFTHYKNDQLLSMTRLPSFYADFDSRETERLYVAYQQCRKKISCILKEQNFLEIVLKKLCEEPCESPL